MKHLAKVILLLAFSSFLIWQSIEIMVYISNIEAGSFSFRRSIYFAFLLNLFMTGIFAFPGFALPTHRLAGTTYYRIKKPEMLKKVCKWLKVDLFRKVLLAVFWGHKKNRIKYFNGTKGGLEHFIYQSKQSEFGHFGAGLVILVSSIYILLCGHVLLGMTTVIFNIIGNLYPILLQRFHRIRIERILTR